MPHLSYKKGLLRIHAGCYCRPEVKPANLPLRRSVNLKLQSDKFPFHYLKALGPFHNYVASYPTYEANTVHFFLLQVVVRPRPPPFHLLCCLIHPFPSCPDFTLLVTMTARLCDLRSSACPAISLERISCLLAPFLGGDLHHLSVLLP